MVERRRKVAPAAFFWSLVLGFAVGHQRSIASLRRFYRATTGTSLVPSSFYDWFNAATVRFLKGPGSDTAARTPRSRAA